MGVEQTGQHPGKSAGGAEPVVNQHHKGWSGEETKITLTSGDTVYVPNQNNPEGKFYVVKNPQTPNH